MFTYELARRLSKTGVTANAVHPGIGGTGFGAEDPGRAERVLVPLLRPFMKPPAKGAATSIYVATAPSLDRVSGRYFADKQPRKSSAASYDTEAAARLWQVSANLVGLSGVRERSPQTDAAGPA